MKKPLVGQVISCRSGLIYLGLFTLFLTACQEPRTGNQTPEFFLPPTLAATPLPPQSSTSTPGPPSPTPSCEDNLVFLEDITIPDGTQVLPGSALDKQWLIQNAGTCNWDSTYRLKLIAGVEMGVPVEQALFPARSGTDVEIRILFTAPEEPGEYRSAWQAYNPDGKAFGDPIYIEILVEDIVPSSTP